MSNRRKCEQIGILYSKDQWSMVEARAIIRHVAVCQDCTAILDDLAHILAGTNSLLRRDLLRKR